MLQLACCFARRMQAGIARSFLLGAPCACFLCSDDGEPGSHGGSGGDGGGEPVSLLRKDVSAAPTVDTTGLALVDNRAVASASTRMLLREYWMVSYSQWRQQGSKASTLCGVSVSGASVCFANMLSVLSHTQGGNVGVITGAELCKCVQLARAASLHA